MTKRGRKRGALHQPKADPSTLAGRIAWARYNQGIAVDDLARDVNVSTPCIRSLERGAVTPATSTLQRIARRLAIDWTDLAELLPPDKRRKGAAPRRPIGRRPDPDAEIVLDLPTDPAARKAMLWYADLVEAHSPTQARAVRLAVGRCATADEIAGHNRAVEAVDGLDPSAFEIARRAESIRRHWTEAEEANRAGGANAALQTLAHKAHEDEPEAE